MTLEVPNRFKTLSQPWQNVVWRWVGVGETFLCQLTSLEGIIYGLSDKHCRVILTTTSISEVYKYLKVIEEVMFLLELLFLISCLPYSYSGTL